MIIYLFKLILQRVIDTISSIFVNEFWWWEWFFLTHYYCRQPWLSGILQMFQLLASLIRPLLQYLHLQCKLMLLHPLCQPYRYPRFQHLLLQFPIMMFLNPSAVIEPQNLWSLLFSPLPLLQQWWYPRHLHPHLLPLHFILLLMYNVHMVLHCYSHFHHQIHHHHLLLLPLQTTVKLFLEKRFEMLFWCLFRLVYLLGACVIFCVGVSVLNGCKEVDNFVWSSHSISYQGKVLLY